LPDYSCTAPEGLIATDHPLHIENRSDHRLPKTRDERIAASYIENFKLFSSGCPDEVVKPGPKRLAQV
jgi:hypothetical protein